MNIEEIESKITNFDELIKAFNYYPRDSEQFEAMAYCIKETFMRYFVPDESTDLYNNNIVLDADQITADFLIENVDLAFAARDRFSWAKKLYNEDKISFFMRVLPYRIGAAKLGQLGAINRHFRAFFLVKEMYESLKKNLNLISDFDDMQIKIDGFSDQYAKAESADERIAILKDVVAYLDIDVFYNAEGVRYFPRANGEQTLYSILTLGEKPGTTETIRGGRCTDMDNLL